MVGEIDLNDLMMAGQCSGEGSKVIQVAKQAMQ